MKKTLFLLSLILTKTILAQVIVASALPQVQNFIDIMVSKHQFKKEELHFLFTNIELKIKTEINDKKKSATPKKNNWDYYKKIFLTQNRIDGGVKFMQDYYQILQKAEDKFGVQKAVIVAILGIETNYGKNTGDYPTMKTLTALSFGKNYRQQFYKKELEHFLLLVRKNEIAPLAINGSYAGAIGQAQFIASSYNHYAIDFNNDGVIDLFNTEDAIGSIANYLARHAWQKEGKFAKKVDNFYQKFAKNKPNKPKYTIKHWQKLGVKIKNIYKNKKIAFITLKNNKINETWLTFWNFYAITRYNHDNKYAMAAVQLANKIILFSKKT